MEYIPATASENKVRRNNHAYKQGLEVEARSRSTGINANNLKKTEEITLTGGEGRVTL